MFLDIHPALSHQGIIVVMAVAPCNNIIYYSVYQVFPVGECHPILQRIHSPPTPSTTNKLLRHHHILPYLRH